MHYLRIGATHTACGRWAKNVRCTDIAADVTCRSCRATVSWRLARSGR